MALTYIIIAICIPRKCDDDLDFFCVVLKNSLKKFKSKLCQLVMNVPKQGLRQDLETGCPKLAK